MGKNFTIHDLPKEERPRERLLNLGGKSTFFARAFASDFG
jgi:hypothetical protein